MTSLGDVIQDDPSSSSTKTTQAAQEAIGFIKSKILQLLLDPSHVSHHYNNNNRWSVIDGLLQQLPVATTTNTTATKVDNDDDVEDPMGRLLLGAILSQDPPLGTVTHVLRAFPCAVERNPAAFFHACQDAPTSSTEICTLLLQHLLQQQKSHSSSSSSSCIMEVEKNDEDEEEEEDCPYPWILTPHITLQGAQALLEVYPQGVLQQSRMLSGYCLLDYFLLSPDMVEQRAFDRSLWNKFKLILLAAEFCSSQQQQDKNPSSPGDRCSVSPVHMILRRVFSKPGFFTNGKQSRHVLWLMHQLRWTDRWVFEQQASDGTYALHYVLSQSCGGGVVMGEDGLLAARELVKLLLEACPGAASVRCDRYQGRLPLHIAVEHGWPCHDLLLAIYPEALDIPDPQTGLFPFQASAALHGGYHCRDTAPAMSQHSSCSPAAVVKAGGPAATAAMVDICDLDVTYELLRANPSHASTLHGGGSRVGAQA